jgi:hypothetical protein
LRLLVSRATVVEATQGHAAGRVAIAANRSVPAIFQFRPFGHCVPGFVALALAVALWGFGYKISLYRHYDRASQMPVAKLWIQHRDATAAISELGADIDDIVPIALPLSVAAPQAAREERGVSGLESLEAKGAATPSSLIPFRSPPTSPSLLT